ncbi:hypothetical protein BMS3Bbin01_02849 [bacterium BMS3Bbin01]|nr:hypothetical protein BMS3Bbin01_02849 [bacterium BMS3Bbin01]
MILEEAAAAEDHGIGLFGSPCDRSDVLPVDRFDSILQLGIRRIAGHDGHDCVGAQCAEIGEQRDEDRLISGVPESVVAGDEDAGHGEGEAGRISAESVPGFPPPVLA